MARTTVSLANLFVSWFLAPNFAVPAAEQAPTEPGQQ